MIRTQDWRIEFADGYRLAIKGHERDVWYGLRLAADRGHTVIAAAHRDNVPVDLVFERDGNLTVTEK
jgi:hypothetical protein